MAEAAHVRANDAMAAGKLRYPPVPRRTAFRVAVQHEDRARFSPGIGEVVDHIVKVEIGWNAQCRHGACLSASRTIAAAARCNRVGVHFQLRSLECTSAPCSS